MEMYRNSSLAIGSQSVDMTLHTRTIRLTKPSLSDGIPSNFHDLIPVMRNYYESDGLFGSVIDLMVQFTVDDRIENVTDDPELRILRRYSRNEQPYASGSMDSS